ncbi:MAG TPA: hypothetical protein VMV92_13590 [Streptosporangiaceae bacterium]|nr:hypothetical protein [Streptosporangiaceae bacterium]
MNAPFPGRDEITLTTPLTRHLCNDRAHRNAGRPAEVIVTYGTLADPGTPAHSRSNLWPESWGRSVPMCTPCLDNTRQVVLKYRAAVVIRDATQPAPGPG